MKNRKLLFLAALSAIILFPVSSFAECGDNDVKVDNFTNYYLQVFVNNEPWTILEPGGSEENSSHLQGGVNTINVKPLTPKGQVNTKIIGPKASKFEIDCSAPVETSLGYSKANFKKKPKPTGHAPAPTKPVKQIGNTAGAKLNIDGIWGTLDTVKGQKVVCLFEILDLGFTVSGTIQCQNTNPYVLQGTRLGSRIIMIGLGQNGNSGQSKLISADFGIFANVDIGDDDTPEKVDYLLGNLVGEDGKSIKASRFVRVE